jgi:hypothetical protein
LRCGPSLWLVGCVGATALLKSAPLGQVTWRNYPAGYLLPWGYILGRGQLPGIVATSWAIGTLIAIAVCILTTAPAATPDATSLAAATTIPVTVRGAVKSVLTDQTFWRFGGSDIRWLQGSSVHFIRKNQAPV